MVMARKMIAAARTGSKCPAAEWDGLRATPVAHVALRNNNTLGRSVEHEIFEKKKEYLISSIAGGMFVLYCAIMH